MTAILDYVRLSAPQLEQLDRKTSVFFMSVSPIEVHGNHLPLGTDVYVAENVRARVQSELVKKRSDLVLVNLPPLYAGSDALPARGSLTVRPRVLESLLLDYVRGLALQGFRYLVLTDNHGGPRHQLAIWSASRTAWRKFGFYLLDPFLEIYRRMVTCDPGLLEMTGLSPGRCGDDSDNHAGTNETSLVMAIDPALITQDVSSIPPSTLPPYTGLTRALAWIARGARNLGLAGLSNDLFHLANILAWVGQENFLPYMGAPAQASPQAGSAMLEAHVAVSLELIERALAGEVPDCTPLLSWLSFMRFF